MGDPPPPYPGTGGEGMAESSSVLLPRTLAQSGSLKEDDKFGTPCGGGDLEDKEESPGSRCGGVRSRDPDLVSSADRTEVNNQGNNYSDASDVSSNDLSGPEDGECESDEEGGGRKSAELVRRNPLRRAPPPPVDFTEKDAIEETEEAENFDLPLEDISPDREAEEEPVDPFADFVP